MSFVRGQNTSVRSEETLMIHKNVVKTTVLSKNGNTVQNTGNKFARKEKGIIN